MVFSVPHEFRDGELAYARQVNANFSAITEQIREINTNKADIELSNVAETGITNIQKASLTRTIGEYVFSLLPLNNSCLHLLDGTVLSGNGIYKQFVEYISDLYDNENNYFISEEDWQTSVETYGICAKFVYDSENNTVRLPKVTGIIEGTTDIDALGDLVEAGLPTHTHTRGNMEITGSFAENKMEQSLANGAFYYDGASGTNSQAAGGSGQKISFAASRNWSGTTSIANYSTSLTEKNTVQPQTVKAFVYIVVATSQKTDLEVDIDGIVTDLNGKVNVDSSNFSNQGKSTISGLGMPSERYTDLTLGASGATYTAPANGYFMLSASVNSIGYIWLKNTTASISRISYSTGNGWTLDDFISVKKDDVISVEHLNLISAISFKFIYAEGEQGGNE